MVLKFSEPETHVVHVQFEDQTLDVEIAMPEGLTHEQREIFMDGAATGIASMLDQWEYDEDSDL